MTESFEELFNQSLNNKRFDKTVTGTVIQISRKGEIFVDFKYNVDGIIPRKEYSDDENANPADEFKLGDTITADVLKWNDGTGNVLLSYKNYKVRQEAQKEKELKIKKAEEYRKQKEEKAKSIQEFGFKVPIVIDKDNIIVTGHTRVKAAKQLGYEKVPCIVADDLNEEQINAFRLVDNKTNEFALWDFEKLEEELSNIQDIDLLEFGFENHTEIDWAGIDDLSEDTYKEPKGNYLKCPVCEHVDIPSHFVKVKDEEA